MTEEPETTEPEKKPSKPMELSELTLPQLWRLKDCMEHPGKYDIDPKHKGTPGQLAAVQEAIDSLKTRDTQLFKKVAIMQATGKGLRRAPKQTKRQIARQEQKRKKK